MGNSASSNSPPPHNNLIIQHSLQQNTQNSKIEAIELQQLHKNLLHQYTPFQIGDQDQASNKKQQNWQNNFEKYQRSCASNGRNQNQQFQYEACSKLAHSVDMNQQVYIPKNDLQLYHQLDEFNEQLTFANSPHNRQNSLSDSSTSSEQSSLGSLRSNQSSTTIYLQLPQFILRSETLMFILNKTLFQFVQFSEFLGYLAIQIFNFGVNFSFIILATNLIIAQSSLFQCLKSKRDGLIQLEKWFLLDFVVTSFTLIFLLIHKYLIDNFQVGRHTHKQLKRYLHLVQNSWLTLYFIKYFVLNPIGSTQFLNYTYQATQKKSIEQSGSLKSQKSSSLQTGLAQCPDALNYYIIGIIVYNYISIIFLCVFFVQNLVGD